MSNSNCPSYKVAGECVNALEKISVDMRDVAHTASANGEDELAVDLMMQAVAIIASARLMQDLNEHRATLEESLEDSQQAVRQLETRLQDMAKGIGDDHWQVAGIRARNCELEDLLDDMEKQVSQYKNEAISLRAENERNAEGYEFWREKWKRQNARLVELSERMHAMQPVKPIPAP